MPDGLDARLKLDVPLIIAVDEQGQVPNEALLALPFYQRDSADLMLALARGATISLIRYGKEGFLIIGKATVFGVFPDYWRRIKQRGMTLVGS
ncbi:MAG: hypothetical protein V1735_02400 [Nanoarchaeota archaeon]